MTHGEALAGHNGRAPAGVLIGRTDERARIAELQASVRRGLGTVLVLRGDAGVGKSSLLDDAIDQAHDFRIVQFVAVESEMQLGFAALHALLMPFLDDLGSLPAPQARALSAAFGIGDGEVPDPFIVGVAALTLLSDAAARQNLLIVVDDAQWLDQESANLLGFIARRLYADRVGVLIAVRAPATVATLFDDLPQVDVDPLTESASRELLGVTAPAPLSPEVEDRVVNAASGNPLSLVELVRELSATQRAGVAVLPEPLPVDRQIETRFLRQVRGLPAASQRLLLTMAAEPTGDIALVLRAGTILGFDLDAIEPAVAADLLTVGTTFGFRHSVIRSAVYQGAAETDRRRTHAALAEATDADRDPDRRAWHLAAAAAIPDEEIAEELERAAGRAARQGSHAATSALFERAAELTPDRSRRALRLLLAAVAALTAGNSSHAHRTVSTAIVEIDDPILLAQARRLQAASLFLEFLPQAADGRASANSHDEIMSIMLGTVRDVAPLDLRLARETILDALPMAVFFGARTSNTVNDTALLALSLELPPDLSPTTSDLMLDAVSTWYVHGPGRSVPALRRSLEALQSDEGLRSTPHTLSFGCWVGFALGDDQAVQDVAGELIESSRVQGALQVLPQALNHLGQSELRMGRLDAAEACFAEQRSIEALSGRHVVAEVAQLMVAAWRGREDEVRSTAAVLSEQVTFLGIGLLFDWIQSSLLTLELSVGKYDAAARLPLLDLGSNLAIDPFKAADLVEAHVRGATPRSPPPRCGGCRNGPSPTRVHWSSVS